MIGKRILLIAGGLAILISITGYGLGTLIAQQELSTSVTDSL